MEVQDLLVLLLCLGGKSLVLVEESTGGGEDLGLVNTPRLTELVHDFLFFVELLLAISLHHDCVHSLFSNSVGLLF